MSLDGDRAVLCLDVDGVVLPIGNDGRPQVSGVTYQQVSGSAGGWLRECWFCPEVVDRLRSWAASGLVEVRWVTTGGSEANQLLTPVLGLGPFEHEPLGSGAWPKAQTVERILTTTARRVVWVDDEIDTRVALGDCPDLVARFGDRVTTMSPARDIGLLPADLDGLEAWLAVD